MDIKKINQIQTATTVCVDRSETENSAIYKTSHEIIQKFHTDSNVKQKASKECL